MYNQDKIAGDALRRDIRVKSDNRCDRAGCGQRFATKVIFAVHIEVVHTKVFVCGHGCSGDKKYDKAAL